MFYNFVPWFNVHAQVTLLLEYFGLIKCTGKAPNKTHDLHLLDNHSQEKAIIVTLVKFLLAVKKKFSQLCYMHVCTLAMGT